MEYLKNEPVSLRDLHKNWWLENAIGIIKSTSIGRNLAAWNESSGNKPSIYIGIPNSAYIPDDADFTVKVD